MNTKKNVHYSNGIIDYKMSNPVGKIIILLWCAFAVATVLWLVFASLSTTSEIFDNKILKSGPHFSNYKLVLEKHNILRYFRNSIIYTALSCAGVIFLAAPASYVLSRYEFRGRKIIQTAYATAMGIPGVMLMVPLYMLAGRLNLTRSLVTLICIYISIILPFSLFYLISFFSNIPKSIHESALIEGCTHVQAFWKVILPLAKPGLISVTIFNTNNIWNEYTWALIFANSAKRRTLALGLQAIVDGMRYSGNWALLFSAVVLVFIPTFVMFLFLSEKIMSGVTAGAVKE